MSRHDELRIADVVEAAEQLAALVADGRAAFDSDWMGLRAAERLLEIIGEASNAISDEFKADYPDVPWRHAFALTHCLPSDDVVLTLVQDGDHRLSRPQDIARMLGAVSELSNG